MRSHLVFLALVVGCGFNETTKPDPTKTPTGTQAKGVLNGEAISADNPPPPISGGTLLVSNVIANTAFASNSDQGKVDVIRWTASGSYRTGPILWTADVGPAS